MSEQAPKRSNLEPHPYREHPLYPDYCAFAVGDEDYCKREQNNDIHLSDDIDQHGRRIPFDNSPEAQPEEGELLPCWCRSGARGLGVKAHMDHGDFGCKERGRYVYCSNCWACGPTYNTDTEAREGWNKMRADLPRATADTNDAELWRYYTAIAVQKGLQSIEDALARAPRATAAVDVLNEDLCMFCGGKTAHEPDCSHGRPSATGETTVEAALNDLRQGHPNNCIELSVDAGGWWLLTRTNSDGIIFTLCEGESVNDCMAQVRATRTEGGESNGEQETS